jgi:ribosomal protein S18 acetylase RimI-like enzyme
MKIREYSKKDESACIEVFHSNCPKYFAPHELANFKNWLRHNATKHYYVIEENDKIIGCGGFEIKDKDTTVSLVWGMIHNKFHRLGFGKKSLEYRLQIIKSLKENATVILNTSQHTYKFYEKIGFKLDKIINDYYGEGLNRYDMSMQLK